MQKRRTIERIIISRKSIYIAYEIKHQKQQLQTNYGLLFKYKQPALQHLIRL